MRRRKASDPKRRQGRLLKGRKERIVHGVGALLDSPVGAVHLHPSVVHLQQHVGQQFFGVPEMMYVLSAVLLTCHALAARADR
eukprot:scaffold519_cov331-Pavlova_lutheri.AAC.46